MSAAGDAWVQVVTTMGGDRSAALAAAADLDRRYGESHRRHHNVQRVNTLVRDVLDLACGLDLGTDDRRVLTLAACAQGVIYDLQPGEDQQASAAWARSNLVAAGISEPIAGRVGALVLSTRNHVLADEEDIAIAVLHDADLAVLGAPAEVYDGYAHNLREEYASVPAEVWRFGRSHVLQSLLATNPLYATRLGRERWEQAPGST